MSFIKLIRENLVLCVGIIIPVVVMVLFAFTPSMGAPPVKYDILLSDQSYSNGSVYFFVRNEKLYVQYLKTANDFERYPKLYLYESARKNFRQLDFTPPDLSDPNIYTKQIEVDATQQMKVDASIRSPDGFQFVTSCNDDDDEGLINELFIGLRTDRPLSAQGDKDLSLVTGERPRTAELHRMGYYAGPGR